MEKIKFSWKKFFEIPPAPELSFYPYYGIITIDPYVGLQNSKKHEIFSAGTGSRNSPLSLQKQNIPWKL